MAQGGGGARGGRDRWGGGAALISTQRADAAVARPAASGAIVISANPRPRGDGRHATSTLDHTRRTGARLHVMVRHAAKSASAWRGASAQMVAEKFPEHPQAAKC